MRILECGVILVYTSLLMKGCVTQNDCPDGLYGVGCSQACTCVTAPSSTVCDSDDGTCTCEPVFEGGLCDKRDFNVSIRSLGQNVYEGGTLTLVCRTSLPVQDVDNYRAEFTLPGPITSYGNPHIIDSRDVGEYRVSLTEVSSEQHSGTYRCSIGTTIPGQGLVTRQAETVINVIIPIPPSVIGSVRATSSSTLLVEWIIISDSGLPEDTFCDVEYKLTGISLGWTTAASDIPITQMTRHLIGDLIAYTDYDVRLTCHNEVGTSNVVEQSMMTGVSYPDSPFLVSADSITETSATIRWYEPFVQNGPISFYRVTLVSNKTPLTVYNTETGQDPFITIDDLVPDTTYTVEVYAVNVDILGQYAGPGSEEGFSFTTMAFPPGPPTSVSVENDEQSCHVQWQEPQSPNGILTSYTVYYTVRGLTETENVYGDVDMEGSITVDGLTQEYRFVKEALKAYSRYDFKITSTTKNGESEPCACENIYCTTEPGAPDEEIVAPERSALSSQTDDRITKTTIPMTINKASNRSGPITCYEVIVIPIDGLQDLAGTTPDEDFPPQNISDYSMSEAQPGHPYVALTFSDDEITDASTVIIGDGSITECSDVPRNGSRRRRNAETVRNREAENGPLRSGVLYSAFVRVYVLVDDDKVEYASSSYMDPVRTNSSDKGPVLQGTIAATAAIVFLMILIGVLILLCFSVSSRSGGDKEEIISVQEDKSDFDTLYMNGKHSTFEQHDNPALITSDEDVEKHSMEMTNVDEEDNALPYEDDSPLSHMESNAQPEEDDMPPPPPSMKPPPPPPPPPQMESVDDLPAYMADDYEESDREDGGASYVNVPRLDDDDDMPHTETIDPDDGDDDMAEYMNVPRIEDN